MAIITMKFGGTSVADLDRIRHVAALVKREVERGNKVAVVVSAMAGETNKLVGWTNEAARPPLEGVGGNVLQAIPDQREYDVVVAAGEQVTAGLLAITLNAMGIKARSWLGWQVPIETSAVHGSARIEGVPASDMQQAHGKRRSRRGGRLPGRGARHPHFHPGPGRLRHQRRGRGGRHQARRAATSIPTWMASIPPTRASCPRRGGWRKSPSRKCWKWRRWAPRCCRPARWKSPCCTGCRPACFRPSRPMWAAPCFATRKTSWKRNQSPASPIAATKPRSPCTRFPDRPGIAASIFGPLADGGVNVDMIVQNVSEDGKKTDLTFTVLAQRAGAGAGGDRDPCHRHRLSRHHP